MNISKTIFKSQDIVAEWWRTYNTKTKYVEGGTKLTLLHLHSHDLIYTTVQSLDVFLFLKTRETRKKDNLKSQQKNYIGSFRFKDKINEFSIYKKLVTLTTLIFINSANFSSGLIHLHLFLKNLPNPNLLFHSNS